VYIHTVSVGKASAAQLQEMGGCVCFALRRTTRAVTQLYDTALRSHGLRVTQLPILVAAALAGALPLAPLAEKLGMERTTLLRNVRPLVRRGLLEVDTPLGSRRTEVRPTAAGRALLARAYPAWKRAQARALAGIADARWSRGLEALASLARATRT